MSRHHLLTVGVNALPFIHKLDDDNNALKGRSRVCHCFNLIERWSHL